MRDLFLVRDCIIDGDGRLGALDAPQRRTLVRVVRVRPGLSIERHEVLCNPMPHPSLRPQEILAVTRDFCTETVTAAQGLFGYLYQHRDPGTQ